MFLPAKRPFASALLGLVLLVMLVVFSVALLAPGWSPTSAVARALDRSRLEMRRTIVAIDGLERAPLTNHGPGRKEPAQRSTRPDVRR